MSQIETLERNKHSIEQRRALSFLEGLIISHKSWIGGNPSIADSPRFIMKILHGPWIFRLVRLAAIAYLSVELSNAPKANALGVKKVLNRAVAKIPDAWKTDPSTGQPRACTAIGGAVRVATKIVLLGGTTNTPTDIVVEAESNRAALRGDLSKLSVAVRDSKSPMGLLEIERLGVDGSDLKLGWAPLATTAGIPLVLLVPPVRRSFWTVSVYFYLWTVVRNLAKRVAASEDAAVNGTARNIERGMESTQSYVTRWRKRVMGGSPCQLRFEMVLSNENLLNSFLLRQSSKSLLTFLMKNSVLQTAAIVGDAVSDSTTQAPKKPSRRNALPGTAAGKLVRIDPQQPREGSPSREDTSAAAAAGDSGSKNKLSRLLSATAFELREAPTFRSEDGKNHLQFVSVAILPDDQARLDFVVRTTLEAGGDRSWLVRFVQPECRFDVAEATSSLPLPKVVSNLLPKILWLPIGAGVSIGGGGSEDSGGGGLSIRDIVIVPGGKCEIRGCVSLSAPPPSDTGGGLVVRR